MTDDGLSVEEKCAALFREHPECAAPEEHFALWVRFNVRYAGLDPRVGDMLLAFKSDLYNYETVRRASRKVINEHLSG
ncbi:MAG: hypothetical protein AAF533_16970 [Acidobacteriota bacterium]